MANHFGVDIVASAFGGRRSLGVREAPASSRSRGGCFRHGSGAVEWFDEHAQKFFREFMLAFRNTGDPGGCLQFSGGHIPLASSAATKPAPSLAL